MRIPQDENKTVSSADATAAMRLDFTTDTGARKFRLCNRTGQDLFVYVTDKVNVPSDATVTNLICRNNAILIVPPNETIEEDVDDDIKIFGALSTSTGTVRVQEKTN